VNSNMDSVIEELRVSYLKSVSDKLVELSRAVTERDFPTVMRIGHQLKGSGRSYGYPDISTLGEQTQDAGENRRAVLAESLLIELNNLMTRLNETSSSSENK
jgi:HPt (histidine-containing phosphotransfer) domain-containing protein